MTGLPHVASDENGVLVLEWWNENRKITLYTGPDGILLKSWGVNIDHEMETVDLAETEKVRAAFQWLAGE